MAGRVLNDGVNGVLRSADEQPREPEPQNPVEPVEPVEPSDRDPSDDFRDGGNDPLPPASDVELSDEERAEAEFFLAAAGADETEEVESP